AQLEQLATQEQPGAAAGWLQIAGLAQGADQLVCGGFGNLQCADDGADRCRLALLQQELEHLQRASYAARAALLFVGDGDRLSVGAGTRPSCLRHAWDSNILDQYPIFQTIAQIGATGDGTMKIRDIE